MDQRTKRRLVGAAVLTLLAVIFVPMLVSQPEEEEERLEVPLEIEEPPEEAESRDPFQAPEDDGTAEGDPPPLETEDVPVPEAEPRAREEETGDEDDEPAEVAEEEDLVEAPDEAVEGAYAVQVGSFSREENAIGERDRLRGLGFSVYLDPTGEGDDARHRVRVGPVMERAEAEELLQRLQEEADADGYVTRQR